MSEDKTAETNGARSFEERVFARFDAIDWQYETKPIWKKVLVELDTMKEHMASLDRKFEVVTMDLMQLRDDQRFIHQRLDRVESRHNPG
jgi:hypothetical protein